MVNFCSKGYFLSPVLLKINIHVRADTSCRKLWTFALYFLFLYSWGTFTSQYVWSTLMRLPPPISTWTFLHFLHLYFLYTWGAFISYVWSTFMGLPPPISIWTFLHFLHLYFLYSWGAFTSYVWSTFMRLPPPVSTWTSTNRPTGGFLRLQCCIPTSKPSCN